MAGWNAQGSVGLSFTAPNNPDYEYTLTSVTGTLGTVNGTCYEAGSGQGPFSHNGSPITVTVTLNGVSSSAVVSTQCSTTKSQTTGSQYPTSSGSGVSFNFGNIKVDGGGTVSGSASWSGILACSSGGSLGLSANWSGTPKLVSVTRQVTLNANGGKFGDGTTSKSASNSAMLRPGSSGPVTVDFSGLGVPTRTNHTFLGWYDASSGGNKVSSPVTLYSDVTYYAHWSTWLKFDLDGGDYSFPEYQQELGSTMKIPSFIPTRCGYDFDGWHDANTNKSYKPGDTYTFSSPTTLRAKWTKRQLTVKAYNNKLFEPPQEFNVEFGSTITLVPGVSEEKTKFVGWDTDEHETGITKSQNINYLWDMTDFFRFLDNKWTTGFKTNQNVVRYVYNNNVYSQSANVRSSLLDPPITPEKDGYEFVGWTADPNSTDVLSSFDVESEGNTLYAVWQYPDLKIDAEHYQIYASEEHPSTIIGQSLLVANGDMYEYVDVEISVTCGHDNDATSGTNYMYLLKSEWAYMNTPIVIASSEQVHKIRGYRGTNSGMIEDNTTEGYLGESVNIHFEIEKNTNGFITLAGGPDMACNQAKISFICKGRRITG